MLLELLLVVEDDVASAVDVETCVVVTVVDAVDDGALEELPATVDEALSEELLLLPLLDGAADDDCCWRLSLTLSGTAAPMARCCPARDAEKSTAMAAAFACGRIVTGEEAAMRTATIARAATSDGIRRIRRSVVDMLRLLLLAV